MDPLTKTQQALRGRDLRDMSPVQLRDWINACEKMERFVKFNKARRGWKQSREEALAELERRGELSP
jgi:hypothetical protein